MKLGSRSRALPGRRFACASLVAHARIEPHDAPRGQQAHGGFFNSSCVRILAAIAQRLRSLAAALACRRKGWDGRDICPARIWRRRLHRRVLELLDIERDGAARLGPGSSWQ